MKVVKKDKKLGISENVVNSMKLSEKMMKEMRQDNDAILEEKANYILRNTQKLNPNTNLENFQNKNNFNYVNSYMRNKLMNEFLRYNPKLHHYKLLKLGEVFPDVKKDYEELDNKLDQDLKEILDDKRNTKRYKNLMERKEELQKLADKQKYDLEQINTTKADTQATDESNKEVVYKVKPSKFRFKAERKKRKQKDDESKVLIKTFL